MPNYSYIAIVGHVGNIKQIPTNTGRAMYRFSVAVNRRYKQEQFTDWFTVISFSEWTKNLQKGDAVLVSGTPAFHEYNGKQYFTIYADNIQRLTKRNKKEIIDDEMYDEDNEPPF